MDVLALQRFYSGPLGEIARAAAIGRLDALWGDCKGLDVLGLGYACPYLEPLRPAARRALAFMPAGQGAERWPFDGPVSAALGDETRLPFADAVFDRVIVIHAIEEAEAPRVMLREIWRVMAPEGRLVVVAANRAGLWARADATPFGHGRPYSRRQLAGLLAEAMFEPTASTCALHAPPIAWAPLCALAETFERAGRVVRAPFGGLVMMEAVKRLYAASAKEGRKILLAKAPARAAPHLREPGASD